MDESKLPTLYVVIGVAPEDASNDFYGSYCNESTAIERECSLHRTFKDTTFSIVEYVPKAAIPKAAIPECRERPPCETTQERNERLGK